MAERRPITARDVKSNVEGYSEMSDEAFARRFYSDRAELLALGVPLQSQRDEFTREELYTPPSENYFLPKLDLKDDELAALQTALYLLEGKFAYAEPFRLALQNLALGRPGFAEASTDTAVRVEVLDPDYSAEMPGRLGKLEAAISKQRTIKFPYYSISRNRESERTLNPYALLTDLGVWYVVFVTPYSSLEQLASWILRQDGRAVPQEPSERRRVVKESLTLVRERHEGEPPKLAREASPARSEEASEHPAGPVVPERFAVL